MIRAIIGTVAVLAGFVVVETSSDASTGLAGSCKATQVYALPAEEPMPVRAAPTHESAVIGTLATADKGTAMASSVVTLTGSKKGWARIALDAKGYSPIDGTQRTYGWIPADLLAVDTRLVGPVKIYDQPGLLGRETGQLGNQDQKFRVLGCRGDLLQVINAQEGNIWIDRWCGTGRSCRD